jgi:carotenoid cleavage oxygenase
VNRYLEGNFAPVHEETTALDLTVVGAVPEHLDGRYLRNGPNPATDPGEQYHWFLGQGMVHGVRLLDGRAEWYRNRWVRPVGEDHGPNTNVVEHAGRTLAIVESGPTPYELTFDLDTVGRCDLGGTLDFGGSQGYTAHPHRDPETGELHAVSYNWVRGNKVDYTVVGANGTVRHHAEIETHGMPMIHDCALTPSYVVVYDLPVTFDMGMVTTGHPRLTQHSPEWIVDAVARGEQVVNPAAPLPYSWDPDYPARIGLVPREGDGSDVQWFEIDPCYVFHTLNAYENGAPGSPEVVIDAVRHPRMFASDYTGPNDGVASLVRFTLDLTSGKAREHRYDEHPQEFPRHDERLTGRRHRYGYAVGMVGPAFGDEVLKHDVVAGTSVSRRLGPGREAGEFCFVPTPGSDVEDDGILMGYVFDPSAGQSELRLLDAGTLEDVASVRLPGRVPTGFHGNWLPA